MGDPTCPICRGLSLEGQHCQGCLRTKRTRITKPWSGHTGTETRFEDPWDEAWARTLKRHLEKTNDR